MDSVSEKNTIQMEKRKKAGISVLTLLPQIGRAHV